MKKNNKKEQHVFIIGSKGIPANYGGFEFFVDRLTFYTKEKNIKYHVSCAVYNSEEYQKLDKEFTYHDAHCFRINVPNIGPGKAIIYDINSLKYCIKYIKDNKIKNPIIYILACRIGPFINHYKKQIKKLGGLLYINPDGHEWLRAKWSMPVKKYWQISERLMVKHADLLVCDNTYIEKYIHSDYKKYNPNTTFIAYGSEVSTSPLSADEPKVKEWFEKHNIKQNNYYLAIGRLVPENNFETMVKEFMKSDTKKDFVLVNKIETDFYNELLEKTHFDQDSRIKFTDGVWDQDLLMYIRENAYGYIHGHEVGGTNPSLLEALGVIDLNLLCGVCFNREVGGEGALYWNKEEGNLSDLIKQADKMTKQEIEELGKKAKKHIKENYSWSHIVDRYNDIFLNKNKYFKK